jgi:O-acetylserine/cysteine efflux transporter
MKPTDLAQALLVITIWGFNFVAIKLGTEHLPPLILTAVRFLLVGLLIVPFKPLPRERWRGVVALSVVLGVAHFGVLILGISGLDVASAAIVLQLSVPFSAAVAAIANGEKLGAAGAAGMALAMGGVALIAGEPHHPDPTHLGLVVFAAAAWAVSNLIVKRIGKTDFLALNGWVSLLAAPQLLALSLCFESGQASALGHAGWVGWGSMIYMVVLASLVAYTVWYRLIERLDLNRVVPLTLLNPVIGIMAGALLLGDPLGWRKILGAIVTLTGVFIVSMRRPEREVAP